MFLVLDTNVLISAALGDGTCRKAFNLASEIGQLVRTEETFLELAATLEKPRLQRYLRADDKVDFLSNFLSTTKSIQVSEKITICRDPKDNMFLELAVACQATVLVSSDKDLLQLHPFRNIPIVTVLNFIYQFSSLQK